MFSHLTGDFRPSPFVVYLVAVRQICSMNYKISIRTCCFYFDNVVYILYMNVHNQSGTKYPQLCQMTYCVATILYPMSNKGETGMNTYSRALKVCR